MDAKNLFKFFPNAHSCFECSDGECFIDENLAKQHCEHFNREYKEIDRDFNFLESSTVDTGLSAVEVLEIAKNTPESKEERKVRLDLAKAKVQAENEAALDAVKAQAEQKVKDEASEVEPEAPEAVAVTE